LVGGGAIFAGIVALLFAISESFCCIVEGEFSVESWYFEVAVLEAFQSIVAVFRHDIDAKIMMFEELGGDERRAAATIRIKDKFFGSSVKDGIDAASWQCKRKRSRMGIIFFGRESPDRG